MNKNKDDNLFYPPALSTLSSELLSTKYLENTDILAHEYLLAYPKMFMYSYSGYWYMFFPKGADKIKQYLIIALPRKLNRTGVKRFRITQDGKVLIEQPQPEKPPVLIPYSE